MTKRTAAQRDPLMQVKMELAAASEDGNKGALAAALTQHPAHAEELTAFHAALLATRGYDDAPITPAMVAIAERASVRAFAAVFGSVGVAATAAEQVAPVATACPGAYAQGAPPGAAQESA